jgi:hypothetical protein
MNKSESPVWKSLLQKLKNLSFAIIPIIFLVLAILIHFSNGRFFLINTDPEYFHLFNGLNLSIFNLAVDYIDHPGTTVQILFAVSAHIVNLLFPGTDIITNALNHPEDFIHGANILLNACITIALFLLGYKTYQYTGNLSLSLLLQLTPIFSIRILIVSGRILPESVLIIPIILLITLIIKYIYDKNEGINSHKIIWAFAIIGGLGMATKILYLPFLIIPLFLLQTKQSRWKYLFYTTLSIIFFAFPLFVNFSKSLNWYTNMLLHSGKWGSGDANIIDLSEIPDRLQQIFNTDRIFFIITGLAIVQLILFFSLKILRNKTRESVLLKRALMALIATAFVFVLLVTKHFAYHYILPVLVLKAFIVFLMASLICAVVVSKNIIRYFSIVTFLLAILIIIPQLRQLGESVQLKQSQVIKFEERFNMLNSYNQAENLLIISPHYRGAPFIQAALAGGVMLSGQLRSTFKFKLKEKYPNTYIYVTWSDQFYFWDEFEDADEFIDPQKPVYIFIGEGKEKDLDNIIDRIKSSYPSKSVDLQVLYAFQNPVETFYELNLQKK